MGDAIYLFASPAMEEKLKTFPDDHRFAMSRGFSVTLKSGNRATSAIDPSLSGSISHQPG